MSGFIFAAPELLPEIPVFGALPIGRLDEHAVVLALDLVERVAQRIQEVLVGVTDRAVERELDHRLRLADGGELALVIGVAQLLLGDIGRVFDDLVGLAVAVEDRIVAGPDPDFLAALADALVLARIEFAAAELLPEQPVFGGLAVAWFSEHAVVLAFDFLERVTQRIQEILVGMQNLAIERKFDDGL